MLEDRCRLPLHLCALLLASLLSAPIPVVLITLNDPFEFKQQEVGFRSRADQACYAGYHGQAVIVAPFGTSANVENPDLAANIIGDWNFVDNNATSLILTGIA